MTRRFTTVVLLACAGALPSMGRADQLVLPVKIRDFTPATHPDFERYIGDDRNMVLPTLDAARLPVYNSGDSNPSVTSGARFDEFYRDVPGVNLSVMQNIVLDNGLAGPGGTYSYSSNAFFPIDGQLLGDYAGTGRNYHFTLQMAASFVYEPGMTFTFTGDDDLWVFIDRRLAIDLGGVHGSESATVNLDTFGGLTAGQMFEFDLFFAERHTTASNFSIQTSIALMPTPGTAGLMLSGVLLMGSRRRRGSMKSHTP